MIGPLVETQLLGVDMSSQARIEQLTEALKHTRNTSKGIIADLVDLPDDLKSNETNSAVRELHDLVTYISDAIDDRPQPAKSDGKI